MTSRFYAADLAAYNSGILHGIWVDATSDADEMQEQIAAMLRASPCPNVTVEHPETNETVPSAEEWVVHDYDDAAKLISHMGETSDLKAIAEAAEAFEEISDDYHETILPFLLDWVRDRVTEPHAWKAALDDAFAGEWTTRKTTPRTLPNNADTSRTCPTRCKTTSTFARWPVTWPWAARWISSAPAPVNTCRTTTTCGAGSASRFATCDHRQRASFRVRVPVAMPRPPIAGETHHRRI